MNIKPKYSTQSERLYFEQCLTFKKTQKTEHYCSVFHALSYSTLLALLDRRHMDTVNGTH